MNAPVFETYWECNGQQFNDIRIVAELVEQGHVAREVTAMEQAEAWELRQAQERQHEEALKRHAEFVQDQLYQNSPHGKAAAARRDALAHGGSRVTVCGPQDAAFSELDQYAADGTNPFK